MGLIDPSFITPKDMPPIPLIVDCALHLFPAMFLWFDFLIFNSEFKRSVRHVAIIYGFGIWYYAWSSVCHSRNSYYPYPFLDQMSEYQRIMFYLISATLAWCMYEFGNLSIYISLYKNHKLYMMVLYLIFLTMCFFFCMVTKKKSIFI